MSALPAIFSATRSACVSAIQVVLGASTTVYWGSERSGRWGMWDGPRARRCAPQRVFSCVGGVALPLDSPARVFLLILVVVLTTPLLRQVGVPRVVNLVTTNVVFNPCKLGVLDGSTDFRLFNGIKVLCVVFLTDLGVSVGSFGRGDRGKVIFKLLSLVVPVVVKMLSNVCVLGLPVLDTLLVSDVCTDRALVTCPVIDRLNISRGHSIDVLVANAVVTITASLLVLTIVVTKTDNSLSRDC